MLSEVVLEEMGCPVVQNVQAVVCSTTIVHGEDGKSRTIDRHCRHSDADMCSAIPEVRKLWAARRNDAHRATIDPPTDITMHVRHAYPDIS